LLGEPVKLSVVLEPLVDADVAAANVEFEAQVDQILRENIRSGVLIESVFIAGNPSIVFALISTDVDPDSEPLASEIQAAEAALTEAGGLPVKLQVLSTDAEVGQEVEASNAVFADIIEKTLNESLEIGELVGFTFDVGNPFIVEVTITTELDQTSNEFLANIKATENALTAALGIPVLLDVTVQSPGTFPATPTTPAIAPTEAVPSPEPTIEPTPLDDSAEATDEPPTATEEPAPTVEASPTP